VYAVEMSGNVYEWQFTSWYSGDYNSNYSTDSDTYAGYGGSSGRVLRGGDWTRDATWMRAASRDFDTPSFRGSDIGFRAARAQ